MSRKSVLFTSLIIIMCLAFTASVVHADPLDFDLPRGGHFYQQANGLAGQGKTGYAISNDDGIAFWDEYQRLGGPTVLGYPASHRFVWDGFTIQIMQKVVFQWRAEMRSVAFLNVIDLLHDRDKDDWLLVYRMTPRPFDTGPDSGLSWDAVLRRHWDFLNTNSAIKARYFSDPNALEHFGLPMSYADMGIAFVVRAQRVVFQYWKADVPWARKGQVTIANGGDLLKEAGVISGSAITPMLPPAVSHDWRAPGYVAAVGGQLYDPGCVLLVSAGINAPNLLFRAGQAETLEWMRQRHLRWVRVFATGHQLGSDRAPTEATSAIAALRAFLARVEAFNSGHPPAQAIYVLVSLTNYYPPGVPGDGYAFDHPTYAGSPVLPAPWFRAGVQQFDFDQEHVKGFLQGLPNYEVNYKPWVQQLVSSVAASPSLMGWQLGNELKARGSPRNGISSAQAYGWYLDFTRDMVDTIRALDRNHLIFMGAQYIAELADWEYRPQGAPLPQLIPEYKHLVQRMLTNCGASCWNVWGLTLYDFNPYARDDARLFAEAGVASVATEYGFIRGTPNDMQQRFGGDRAAAVQAGLARPWQNLDGQMQPQQWGALELIARAPLAGIAHWGSPAPSFEASFDIDGLSGITGTPDEVPLWDAWTTIATQREAANRATSPSNPCLTTRSP